MNTKSTGRRSTSPRSSGLRLEALEPRILLTAVAVGEFFIYKGGDSSAPFDGDLLRIEVVNDVTGVGQAEVMRWDGDANDVSHIPGLLNGAEELYGGLAGEPCGEIIGSDPWLAYEDIHALATNIAGEYYGVENNTGDTDDIGRLVSINPATGSATDVGALRDDRPAAPPIDYPHLRYDNVPALDFDSTGTLWGVATQTDTIPLDAAAIPPDPHLPDAIEGLLLITIDPATGLTHLENRFADDEIEILTMAFNAGDTLYAVNGDNHLGTLSINPGGEVVFGDIGLLTNTADGSPVTGMNGIEFGLTVGGTLYGVAGGELFEINTGNAQCTMTGNIGVGNLSALTFDVNDPDYLWSVNSPGGADKLVRLLRTPPKPADIFSVYLSEADAYTELRIGAITPYTDVNGATWYDDVDLWDATSTPYIATVGGTAYYAP
ncbi:MAG: hypothetical protein ISS72_07390, partial [Candidatus Brocadiae bacterium]|nr:hypothetical protein [Candidatus Brocadiia bacterium]